MNACDDTLPLAGGENVEARLKTLVLIDSRNLDVAPDTPGGKALAEYAAAGLDRLGCITSLHGSPAIGQTLSGSCRAWPRVRAVVLEALLDMVPGAVGLTTVRTNDGRLHARGACDVKGSLGVVRELAADSGPPPTVIVAALADEECVLHCTAEPRSP